MMTTETYTPRITALRSEILPRLRKHVDTLFELASLAALNSQMDNFLRFIAQALAIRKVVDEQSNRLVNVKTEDEVIELINIIRLVGSFDGADEQGTQFAIDHIFYYLSAVEYLNENRPDAPHAVM